MRGLKVTITTFSTNFRLTMLLWMSGREGRSELEKFGVGSFFSLTNTFSNMAAPNATSTSTDDSKKPTGKLTCLDEESLDVL